jgi:hypothetical protein
MRRVLEILVEAEGKKAKKKGGKIKYKYTDLAKAIRKALKGARRGFGKAFESMLDEDAEGMRKKTAAQKRQWQDFQKKGAQASQRRKSAAGGGAQAAPTKKKGMGKKKAKAIVRKGLGGAASYPPVFGR